jgi:hypothetical protein
LFEEEAMRNNTLVVVAVDKQGSDIEPMLRHAAKTAIDDTTKGDLDGLFDDAIAQATS